MLLGEKIRIKNSPASILLPETMRFHFNIWKSESIVHLGFSQRSQLFDPKKSSSGSRHRKLDNCKSHVWSWRMSGHHPAVSRGPYHVPTVLIESITDCRKIMEIQWNSWSFLIPKWWRLPTLEQEFTNFPMSYDNVCTKIKIWVEKVPSIYHKKDIQL